MLFACYLHISRTQPVNSDGAANALQAWDMLHGNLLLHNWWLSDVSFYTTELPEYMLVELVRGLNADVVHVAAALTYTLVVLLAAVLAKGRATGREAAVRMLLAGGILVAPQLGAGAYILLLSPDHVGSTVPVLLIWLLLDRAPRRWWVPVLAGALMTWALIGDGIVLYTGFLRHDRLRDPHLPGRRGAAGAGHRAPVRARADPGRAGGRGAEHPAAGADPLHRRFPGLAGEPAARRVRPDAAPPRLYGTRALRALRRRLLRPQGQLRGPADPARPGRMALAGWAVCAGVRRFFRDNDLVDQVLVAGVLIGLTIYVLGKRVSDINSTREFAEVLPFAAVLAGRLLA